MSPAPGVRTGTVRRPPASAAAWAALVLLGSEACGRAAPAGEGRAPTEASTVFDLLEGAWAGEGSLFGRPAFKMTWTAPTDGGRTEYRVAADGTVRVRDWVRSNGELRPFGEAVYRRR